MRRALSVAALVLALAACGKNQDPGVVPSGGTTGGPTTTSHLVTPCPPGGPDATTPAVGCLDKDGNLVHP
jgi:hypothetical protein